MSANEQFKLSVIYKLVSKQLTQDKAALILRKSERTIRRYIREFKKHEFLFVKHGNSGKPPANKTPEEIKNQVIWLIENKYYDFNIIHLQEKLLEHDINVSRETLRRWAHELNMVKKSHNRRSKPRKYRSRMNQRGMMLQMDGSHHRWFGDVETCLIAAIDDATSEIIGAEFVYAETTEAYLKCLKDIIEEYGVFEILYVDKAGALGGGKRAGFTQVQRALEELGVQVIFANSAEAKGRIERLFNTLQDRMIPEMRIRQINTFKKANDYLKDVYIKQHNNKFAVEAECSVSRFKAVPANINLDQNFAIVHYRQVAKDHTISLNGQQYLINNNLKYSIHNQKIKIIIYPDKKWEAYFGVMKLQMVKIDRASKLAA